jgi:DNA-directed RNA polymerase specialized sigma subunit
MDPLVTREQALEWVLSKISASKKTESKSSFSFAPKPLKAPSFKLPSASPPTLATQAASLQATRAKEQDLYKQWVTGGKKPQDLEPLLKSYAPLIHKATNKFKGRVEIPTSAIDFEAKRLFVNALNTWSPKGGASLPTYVNLNLKKLQRFVQTTQNLARIPEHVIRHVGTYQAAKADLTDRLGHEPDDQTLFEEAHRLDPRISMGHIKRINKELRKGYVQQGYEGSETFKTPDITPRVKEVIGLVHHQLNESERAVHEYWFGLNGKPQLSTSQIAKKMKWDAPKVSKTKKAIWGKIQKYLQE